MTTSDNPSPEPAAIPKTTKARAFWIVQHEEKEAIVCTTEVNARQMAVCSVCRPSIIHVREVTGEGRKVSAAALNWFRRLLEGTGSSRHPHAAELLCVLSEEGGRQKEGGTKITSASESSETSTP